MFYWSVLLFEEGTGITICLRQTGSLLRGHEGRHEAARRRHHGLPSPRLDLHDGR